MTTIALINKTNKDRLEVVKSEMLELGAPTINVIFDEGQGVYVALEGSHRLQAAKELDLIPTLIVSKLKDTDIHVEDLDLGIDDCEYTVDELLAQVYRTQLVDFDEVDINEQDD